MNFSHPTITEGSELLIGRAFWLRLMRGLRRRGGDVRESGAFLLAPFGSRRVSRAVYYDDLDRTCLDEGYIRFNGQGYMSLTKICQQASLRVIADVHTHPGGWTGQSESDRDNPMMARPGHIALIVPTYAKNNCLRLKGVGAYIYHGDGRWENFRDSVRLVLP